MDAAAVNDPPLARLLTVPEAATYLGLHHVTVRRMISRGELRASRIGQHALRIAPADLVALADGQAR